MVFDIHFLLQHAISMQSPILVEVSSKFGRRLVLLGEWVPCLPLQMMAHQGLTIWLSILHLV